MHNANMVSANEASKAFIREMAERAELTPSALARKAGLAPSTVNRLLSNEHATHGLSLKSITRLGAAAGLNTTDALLRFWKLQGHPPPSDLAALTALLSS